MALSCHFGRLFRHKSPGHFTRCERGKEMMRPASDHTLINSILPVRLLLRLSISGPGADEAGHPLSLPPPPPQKEPSLNEHVQKPTFARLPNPLTNPQPTSHSTPLWRRSVLPVRTACTSAGPVRHLWSVNIIGFPLYILRVRHSTRALGQRLGGCQ